MSEQIDKIVFVGGDGKTEEVALGNEFWRELKPIPKIESYKDFLARKKREEREYWRS